MACAVAGLLLATPAMAVVVELKDVAADRIERQRAWFTVRAVTSPAKRFSR